MSLHDYRDRYLCDKCRHVEFIASPHMVKCWAQSGAIRGMRAAVDGIGLRVGCEEFEPKEKEDR